MKCKFQYRAKTFFNKNIGGDYKPMTGYYNDYAINFSTKAEFDDKITKSYNLLKNDCEGIRENGKKHAYSFITGEFLCDDRNFGGGVSCKKTGEGVGEFSYQSFRNSHDSEHVDLLQHPTFEEAQAQFESYI